MNQRRNLLNPRGSACSAIPRLGLTASLADALALRASYIQVENTATRLSHFEHTNDFRRLVAVISDMVDPAEPVRGGAEGWVRRWLTTEALALNRRRPIDVAMELGGMEQLERLLGAICAGSYL